MTLKNLVLVPTGRTWGNKLPETRKKVKGIWRVSKDFWEGPVEPGETGQYFRGTFDGGS